MRYAWAGLRIPNLLIDINMTEVSSSPLTERKSRMFRRKTLYTELLNVEKTVYEAINKLIAARSKASFHHLQWAKCEENPLLFSLCGRIAEINWIGNEFHRYIADRQLELSQVFKDLYHEEKIVEEARKDLQGCASKVAKLQKQVESVRKKNDSTKLLTLEVELGTQTSLFNHFNSTVEAQKQQLELHKVSVLKKCLGVQAEGFINMASQSQALFEAQLQLLELVPDAAMPETSEECEDINQQMVEVVHQVSELLNIHPPPNGGIDPRRLSGSPSQSPASYRHSLVEPIAVDALPKPKSRSLGDIGVPENFPKRLLGRRMSHPVNLGPLPKLPREPPATAILESGEYVEIDSDTSKTLLHAEARLNVQMRRSQSGSSPLLQERRAQNKQRHLSTVSIDEYHEATLLDDTIVPTDHQAESGSDSIPYSSMEDLGLGDVQSGYANVVASGNGIESSLDSESDEDGYANPIDALHTFLDTRQGDGEGGGGPYQTIEEVRRMRELQIQERQRVDSSSSDSGRQSMLIDDNPGYSRPFDALMGYLEPFKVTPEVPLSSRKLNISPLPWQRGVSPTGDRWAKSPKLERSVAVGGETKTQTKEHRTSLHLLHVQASQEESCLDYPPGRRTPTSGEYLKHPSGSPLMEKRLTAHLNTPNLDSVPRPPTSLPPHAVEQRTSPVLLSPRGLPIVGGANGHWPNGNGSDASEVGGRLKRSPAAVKKLRSGQAQLVTPEAARKSFTN